MEFIEESEMAEEHGGRAGKSGRGLGTYNVQHLDY